MLDRSALDQLFSQYAYSMDADRFELLGTVLTDDATFSVAIAGAHVAAFHGREAIVDFIRDTTRGQASQRRHVITNLFVESSTAESASVAATLTLLVVDGGVLAVKSCGVYRCAVVRDGASWRFRTMDLALDVGY